ncbi:MAG TPA: FAD-dependent oxidoreductase [Marmoricola sp.]|nr:FAD-dependent oxidoreductase [Marmoricola sp.]
MTASTYYQPCSYDACSLDTMPAGDPALPVVVVGAGPVGMAVALGLAQRGVSVVVLEAATQVSFGSRAICVSRHSLEVADRLGFGERLSDLAVEWAGGRSFYRDQEVMRFQMPNEPHSVRAPMVNVSQSELEQIMVDTVAAHPLVTLHWGARVTGVTQSEDEVVLEIATADGPRTMRAAWVVAADGGRSPVRDALGLRLQGLSYEGRYVIADIHWESDLPAERMVWFDPPSNPGSTVIMHQQPGDIWRIDYQLDPTEDAEIETREERIRARIASHLAWLGDDRPWSLEWHGFYKAHALALDSFVHDRVVFAGDAAHLVPIFGVRGLNSGMEDAEALAWMLAAVVNGTADRRLLESYSAERHHAWEQNVANAGKSTLIMTPGTHGHRTTRDALLALATGRREFSHLIDPRQSSATHARASSLTVPARGAAGGEVTGMLPGDPLEDRRVVLADGKETSVHQLRGTGFGIFGIDLSPEQLVETERLRHELAMTLLREDVSVVLVGARSGGDHTAVVPDPEREVAQAWGASAGELYVVRPDGLLLARGRAGDLDGLAAHLAAGGATSADTTEETADRTVDPGVTLPVGEARREAAWLGLSEGIDAVPADDREQFLARVALLLGDRVDPADFQEAVSVAASVR